jgi:hypothetical protein
VQALKKARRFEERKTARRLKECSSDRDGAQQGNALKLQQQLEAARTLDIEALTTQVRERCHACVHAQQTP